MIFENRALLRVLENIVFQNWKFLQCLAAGKTDFRIFRKLKRITRRASSKIRNIEKLSFWFASLEDLQAPTIINILY